MKPKLDMNREKKTVLWVEVAPGLSFGYGGKMPTPWRRWWLKRLLGWTFRTTREPGHED